MGQVADTCIWIDFLRPKTPASIRRKAYTVLRQPDLLLCEPVRFEILRSAPRNARAGVAKCLDTVPLLETPRSLWDEATLLGQKCGDLGISAGPYDLLIATLCQFHEITLATFDAHFLQIAEAGSLKVTVLERA
jgi:predicted nucleic acid-binding protein